MDWAIWIVLPLLALQAGAMALDEFVCHHDRGLGAFERWGHPVDTAFFGAALLVPATASFGPGSATLFAGLGLISLLIITKDEWIHTQSCDGFEHWLHAVLFVVHGPILCGVAWLWYEGGGGRILQLLPLGVFGFGVYQIVYWNIWQRTGQTAHRQQRLLQRTRG